MKKRLSELSKYGVKEEANAQLNSLHDRANVYRKLIKANYLPDQWEKFGLLLMLGGVALIRL